MENVGPFECPFCEMMQVTLFVTQEEKNSASLCLWNVGLNFEELCFYRQ